MSLEHMHKLLFYFSLFLTSGFFNIFKLFLIVWKACFSISYDFFLLFRIFYVKCYYCDKNDWLMIL